MISVDLYPDEYLRIMRYRLEMTQTELAQRLGVTRQMVNYYENGILKISEAKLKAVKAMAEEEVV